MTTVTLTLHFEHQDSGEAAWWAEGDEVHGFYVAGRSFAEVAGLAREALIEDYGPDVLVRWLTAVSPETGTAGATAVPSGFRDTSDTAVHIPA